MELCAAAAMLQIHESAKVVDHDTVGELQNKLEVSEQEEERRRAYYSVVAAATAYKCLPLTTCGVSTFAGNSSLLQVEEISASDTSVLNLASYYMCVRQLH